MADDLRILSVSTLNLTIDNVLNNVNFDFTGIATNTTADSVVVIGTKSGSFWTADGGLIWRLSTDLRRKIGNDLRLTDVKTSNSRVLVMSDTTMAYSENFGNTYKKLKINAPTGFKLRQTTFDPSNLDRAYAVGDNNLLLNIDLSTGVCNPVLFPPPLPNKVSAQDLLSVTVNNKGVVFITPDQPKTKIVITKDGGLTDNYITHEVVINPEQVYYDIAMIDSSTYLTGGVFDKRLNGLANTNRFNDPTFVQAPIYENPIVHTGSRFIEVDARGDIIALAPTIVYLLRDFPTSVEPRENVPKKISLSQNYPNPFNAETIIPYSLEKSADVYLAIYNLRGKKVKTLINKIMQQGTYTTKWFGKNNEGIDVSSGVYIYEMKTDTNFKEAKKMVLLR